MLSEQLNKLDHSFSAVKFCVACWGMHCCAGNHQPDSSYFRRVFGAGQNSSMSGFCALRQFQFNHFHVGTQSVFTESQRTKFSIFSSTTEISCTYLPYKVSSMKMVLTYASFSCIMCEATD